MLQVLTFLATIYILTKQRTIMATLAEFQEEFDKQNAAIDDIIADIEYIKSQIVESGLTAAEEDALLASIKGLTSKVENLATENVVPPVEPPVEPQPEEPETPVIPEEEV